MSMIVIAHSLSFLLFLLPFTMSAYVNLLLLLLPLFSVLCFSFAFSLTFLTVSLHWKNNRQLFFTYIGNSKPGIVIPISRNKDHSSFSKNKKTHKWIEQILQFVMNKKTLLLMVKMLSFGCFVISICPVPINWWRLQLKKAYASNRQWMKPKLKQYG